MRSHSKLPVLLSVALLLGPLCYGATIAGTVKDPDGAPFEGATIQAQNTKTRITTIVLSDSHGHYRVENLPAGEYRVQIRAVGYRSNPHTGVNLTPDQNTSVDISLEKGTVHWNDLSIYQAGKLWPASKARDKIFSTCFTCHGFQTRIASVTRDQDGWRDRVRFMQEAMRFGLADRINDQEGVEVADYLTSLYGPDSVLPRSPADMPEYKETLRSLSGGSPNNIVFVEYDMPGPSRMPFDANPAKDGSVWIPDFGVANKITKLDPETGEMQDFPVPNVGTAAVHSAVAAPDGSVWLTEQGSNKLGRWDPATREVTEYQDAYIPGKLGYGAGSKHTLRFDPAGNVWASGNPLTRFNPETQKFNRFNEVPTAYDVKPDKSGNIWFTKQDTHQIGRVDWKTLKVSIWTPPTKNCFPRRIEVDSDGIVWFGEFNSGKIGRFDPKTETFKEYDLPGPQPTPYGLGIDADHNIWYSSYFMDVLGRFDPKTGKVTEYPFPHSENSIRELIPDSHGRMWYGSPSNNKVGYFYLTGNAEGAEHASK